MQKVAPSKALVIDVVRQVAQKHSVKPEDILSGCRRVPVWRARREALTVIHEVGEGRFSTTGIGRAFGVDHATVIYNIRQDEYRQKRREQVLRRHYSGRSA
jgi:chromosomal replication initiation ATPase DnaA